jgi:hypothetical protein
MPLAYPTSLLIDRAEDLKWLAGSLTAQEHQTRDLDELSDLLARTRMGLRSR